MSVVMVAIITQKMGLFKVKLRFVLSSFLVALDFVIMQLQLGNLYLVNAALLVLITFMYKNGLKSIFARIRKKKEVENT